MKNELKAMGTSLQKMAGRTSLKVRKNSPEILMGLGIVGVVGTVILACKATLKAEKVLDKHREEMDEIEEALEMSIPEEYNEDDAKKDKAIVYARTAGRFVRLYAPTIAAGSLTIAAFLTSNKIMKSRYLGAVAMYNACQAAFDTYRQRVKDELGDEADRHFRYGTTREKIDVEYVDENGKTKKKKEEVENISEVDIPGVGQYARWFDSSSPDWDENPEMCIMFLRAQENIFNNILQTRGHVFLNEVYDALGLPHTQVGSVAGWVMGAGDNYIDFGLYNKDREDVRRFVNGNENIILLDFNCDGVIWDKI